MKKFVSVLTVLSVILSGCGVVGNNEDFSSESKVSSELTYIEESSFEQKLTESEFISSESTSTTAVQTIETKSVQTINHITISTEAPETRSAFSIEYSEPEPVQQTAENNSAVSSVALSATTVSVITTLPPVAVTETKAQKHLSEMTLHEKVCQMFIATPESISGYDVVSYVDCPYHSGYRDYPVGGLILFAQNIETSDQTSALVADMQYDAVYAGTGAFISVDEEGGNITRIQSMLGTEAVNTMSYYGDLNDWNSAFAVGQTIGSYLADYGFNLDFAPVADVNISPYNELGSRIFSSDPKIVADMSSAVVDGLQSQGICSTLKHFPGLGAGNGNTHYNTVIIDRTYEQLQAVEFPAFKGGIDAGSDFVMVGHQITTASGDNLPGDLSPVVVTEWLKGELGFNGIAVTDSHSMGAISNVYTSGEAAVMAVEAGIDMILMPYNLADAVSGIEQAIESGRLTESRIDESVLKILEKKSEIGLI
ncbi:MAG: glycoside hydrolase family 3 protein [Ruminococcus sp.]|nr:glycoside hydrolase family 3 protein [Ruminococcus sp.]